MSKFLDQRGDSKIECPNSCFSKLLANFNAMFEVHNEKFTQCTYTIHIIACKQGLFNFSRVYGRLAGRLIKCPIVFKMT